MIRRKGWARTSAAALIASLLSSTAHAAFTAGHAGVAMMVQPGSGAPPQITPLQTGASGQVLTAPPGTVLDLLFTDGTSLTLSPGGSLRLDGYSFDPVGGAGELRLTILNGVARVIGGQLGPGQNIFVSTPTGSVRVGQSVAAVTVDAKSTQASLIAGDAIQLASGEASQSIERAGFAATTSDGKPQSPEQLSGEQQDQLAVMFNPALTTLTNTAVVDSGEPAIDNTSQTVAEVQRDLAQTDVGGASGGNTAGGISANSVFDPGAPGTVVNATGTRPSAFQSGQRSLTQNRAPEIVLTGIDSTDPSFSFSNGSGASARHDKRRDGGLTTNRLFPNRAEFSDRLEGTDPMPLHDLSSSDPANSAQLQYYFFDGASYVAIAQVGEERAVTFVSNSVLSIPGSKSVDAAVIAPTILFNSPGLLTQLDLPSPLTPGHANGSIGSGGQGGSVLGDATISVLQSGFFVIDGPGAVQETIWQSVPMDPSFFPVVSRQRDNFMFMQIDPDDGSGAFVFAAGDVDSDLPEGPRRLDQFFLSPGLTGLTLAEPVPTGSNIVDGTRGFLRNETVPQNMNLVDTGLLVVGKPADSTQAKASDSAQTAALHADFGIGPADASGRYTQSTISATVGEVRYRTNLGGSPVGFVGTVPEDSEQGPQEEVGLVARTVGSTRVGGTSGTASTNLFNTAAGGGNTWATENGSETLTGRAGYFVIENYVPGDSDTGGQERTIGRNDREDFALLRLATGVRSEALSADAGFGGELSLYAAGLEESENGNSGPSVSASLFSKGTLQASPADNRIEASFGGIALGGLTGEGTKGRSAYIDSDRFAARSSDSSSNLALVSSGVLKDTDLTRAPNVQAFFADSRVAALDSNPDYKWGFFFGDTNNAAAGAVKHVHLGTWIAGNIVDASRLPTTGQATYNGTAIGNVLNGSQTYTALGTYSASWNFASRAGDTRLNFDGPELRGFTLQPGTGPAVFGGTLSGGARTATINGAFVGDAGQGVAPRSQIGQFGITGAGYVAAGTFGAKR